MKQVLVAALYKFVALPNYEHLRQPLLQCCQKYGVKGTLLLASEGINGTIAGPPEGIHQVLKFLRSDDRLADLQHKESQASSMPFFRMKVRLKKEIVTMGVVGLDPAKSAGTYVSPEHWNELISNPDVIIIDTRNDYEVAIGTFEGAINPQTKSFRELPGWLNDRLAGSKKPPVAMFCTGGIRCEKSTAYLKSEGFENVYHLQGGILNYLEKVDESESLWKGECFVFDQRVSVRHGLEQGSYDRCHACRMPIHEQDKQCETYEQGVSCLHCHGERSDEDRRRFAERQKQVDLAAKRGKSHLGIRRFKQG